MYHLMPLFRRSHLNRDFLVTHCALLERDHLIQLFASLVSATIVYLLYLIASLFNLLSPLILKVSVSQALAPLFGQIDANRTRAALWKTNISYGKTEIRISWRGVRSGSATQTAWIVPSKARSQDRREGQLLLILVTTLTCPSVILFTFVIFPAHWWVHSHLLQILVSVVPSRRWKLRMLRPYLSRLRKVTRRVELW